ncbi:MAG TPA: hypothetical protein DCM28_09955 [Phycisphaerales bacterium]|nr:hypothetical protein [Phycisphaerales bacterium]HCD32888.1 hypothetical protein [Phycisphaerales bacterium]|tara:strand:+ start:2147 stop:2428 length:282 start_codon:yes stop_codon:yes gene_type:complete
MNTQTFKDFNCHPSYGTSGLDIWLNFDAMVIDHELGLGKQYFPKMNAIRLWLSWDAYKRDPQNFVANFDAALNGFNASGIRMHIRDVACKLFV